MLFKRSALLASALVASLTVSGCGLLGEKGDLKKLLEYNSEYMGCLNELGPRFTRYVDGAIEKPEWESTWDCAIDSLEMFKKYVNGSVENGYSREDIRAFLNDFMLTADRQVSPELMAVSFELKASIFGGSAELLTYEEMDRFIGMLKVGKKQSTEVLPHLQLRSGGATSEELLALADAIASAGEGIASSLDTGSHPAFNKTSFLVLAEELKKLHAWNFKADTVLWLMAGKAVLIGGSRDMIEGHSWPDVFRAATSYGGPLAAYKSERIDFADRPNAGGEFVVNLVSRIKAAVERTLDLHGGALQLEIIDRFIDALPPETITVDRLALQKTLRPAFGKIFKADVADAVDRKAVAAMFSTMDDWRRGQTHLEAIYAEMKADSTGVTKEAFTNAANEYASQKDHQAQYDVSRLIFLSQRYEPMFVASDKQITFQRQTLHSLHNLGEMHWMRLVGELLMRAYGSGTFKDRATLDDVKVFFEDFTALLVAIKKIDPTVADIHKKRFRDANLFMRKSNGDRFVDVDEFTEYLAVLSSIGTLSNRILETITPICPNLGEDWYGWQWMRMDCFRREYFERRAIFWDHFPGMRDFYDRQDGEGRHRVEQAMERAARRYGIDDTLPIGAYDIEGYSGILHYLDLLFLRFDESRNSKLDLEEVMRAYPVFKLTLADIGKLDPRNNTIIESAFTYIVKFGRKPETDNIWGLLHFGGWILWRPFWSINADRGALYQVISVLADPEKPATKNPDDNTGSSPAPAP